MEAGPALQLALNKLKAHIDGRGPAVWLMGLLLAIGTAHAVTGPFRAHAFWMNFEQDDFFYYLKVAQNFAEGHGSTFNGIVPTNGYHPLWMLTLAAVIRLGAAPHGIFIFLAVTIWVATLICFGLAARIFLVAAVPAWLSTTAAAFVAVFCMHLFAGCMEVILAVPFMFALMAAVQSVAWWSAGGWAGWRRAAAVGLLAAATVLARLDTAIFVALLGAGVAAQRELRCRTRLPQVAGVLTGLLPVGVYVLVNHHAFGVWMPISGMAKELKVDHAFSAKPWHTLAELTRSQVLNLYLIGLAALALPVMWRRLTPSERVLATAALLFPFLYFGLLSWLSDWRLWGWYFYSLRPALCGVFLVAFRVPLIKRVASWRPVLAAFLLFTLSRVAVLVWDEQVPDIAAASVELRNFGVTHPGVYAMGDRAGAAGYLLPEPMIQTEGLMMDRSFLRKIAAQMPLRQALAPFGVRYYVATSVGPYTGCFHAVEPWQAGRHAPHMRATFCEPPLAHWQHGEFETLVFDVSATR